MSDTLYVTPAQVLAAKLAIELGEEDGDEPDEALKAIALAQAVTDEKPTHDTERTEAAAGNETAVETRGVLLELPASGERPATSLVIYLTPEQLTELTDPEGGGVVIDEIEGGVIRIRGRTFEHILNKPVYPKGDVTIESSREASDDSAEATPQRWRN